jgi:hypothetical protein
MLEEPNSLLRGIWCLVGPSEAGLETRKAMGEVTVGR